MDKNSQRKRPCSLERTRCYCIFRSAFGGANRQHGHKIHSLLSVCTFRDYFVAELLVPLLRNGANRGFLSRKSTKKKEMQKQCFRDYFAPSGLVPLLRNGANRGFSPHKSSKKKEMPKQCFRDYFAPSGLVPLLRNGANRGSSSRKSSKKKEMQVCISFFLVHFQGLEPWAH